MSRILLLSDIHSNLPALDAVLADAMQQARIDEVWSLGDAVGYGPRPNECITRLRELSALAVVGNHELAATGAISTRDFNPYARAAAEWTAGVLTSESTDYIESLSSSESRGDFTLVHGSPRDTVWEYVTSREVAAANLGLLETPHCVNGHTHVPAAMALEPPGSRETWPSPGQVVDISEGRWFLNPGSVGQPRDGDPRASYAVIDTDAMSVSFFRVEYPVGETQHQMKGVGLPDMLIERLAYGR